MSLVGAVISPERNDIRTKIAALASASDTLVQTEASILVAFHGPSVTVHRSQHHPDSGFAAVDGSPLVYNGSAYSRPSAASLGKAIQLDDSSLHECLAGQYAIVRTDGDGIELVCDPNSLRSFFLYREKDFVLFASRLHGITSVLPGLSVDFRNFGSHWLAHNQLNDRFFLRGVQRINGRRFARIGFGSGSLQMEFRESPGFERDSPGFERDSPRRERESPGFERDSLFSPVTALVSSYDGPVRLALSGGLDSRLLLAVTQKARPRDFGVIVYETSGNTDANLATRLARQAGIPCHSIPRTPIRDLIEDGTLAQFARDSFCLSPLSAAVRLTHYKHLFEQHHGLLLLDGAFGEVGRGQFYRRVALLRRMRSLLRPDSPSFARALAFTRADIFNEDAAQLMNEGFESDVLSFVRDLDVSETDRPEDWAGVRYRRANFFGYSQSWLDRFGFNCMPLGQDQFVRRILSLPLSRRKGGRLYREVIRKNAPELSQVMLSKGSLHYPFNLSGSLVPAYARLFGRSPSSSERSESIWTTQSRFITELVESRATKDFAPYDMKKVTSLATDFLRGRVDRSTEIDWFLSFELWRRGHNLT